MPEIHVIVQIFRVNLMPNINSTIYQKVVVFYPSLYCNENGKKINFFDTI